MSASYRNSPHSDSCYSMVLSVSQQPGFIDRSQTIFPHEGKFLLSILLERPGHGQFIRRRLLSWLLCPFRASLQPFHVDRYCHSWVVCSATEPPNFLCGQFCLSCDLIWWSFIIGGFSPFYTSCAPSVFTIGPS